ncbi:MAG TPA: trehalase family glycosidase [Patescibacteria group bacterium]|nr:trehalase family glycosidase [Patescibacteria group bacterium]
MSSTDNQAFLDNVKKALAPFKTGVKRRAQGVLKYDYLVPAGYYQEQWDWDGFFIGLALAQEIPSEAIFLRNWALNYMSLARSDGYSPACVTSKGPETGTRAMLMKPFLAQGAYLSSVFLNDFSWIKPHYAILERMATYRWKHVWNKKYDLAVWQSSMESGADNNLAALDFPKNSVVATDANSFIYREFLALSKISEVLGERAKAKKYNGVAKGISERVNKYLWDETDQTYYNIDTTTGNLIRRMSYNSVHPIWAGIAPQKRAKAFIEKNLLNPKKLWSTYGVRTLAKDDKEYHNTNMIKPHSNWQGPIWPIANFFFVEALIRYGYQKEAIMAAKAVAKICIDDIGKSGGMHENYDAETGNPIAAPNFISWNLLVPIYLQDAIENTVSFTL